MCKRPRWAVWRPLAPDIAWAEAVVYAALATDLHDARAGLCARVAGRAAGHDARAPTSGCS